jgi:hypothetical protein
VLLRSAGISSLNHKLVKAVTMETWAAYHSTDGVDGARNPVGSLLFGYPTGRTSRATVAGIIPLPMPGSGTFTTNAARIWNASTDLLQASMPGMARVAAAKLAASAPL